MNRRPDLATSLLLAWVLASTLLAVLPAGFGGTVRVVDEIVFMTTGPALCAVFRHQRSFPSELTQPRVTALWGASIAYLVLAGMALLVVGLWSVPLMVLLVAAPCLALLLVDQRTWTEVTRRVAR